MRKAESIRAAEGLPYNYHDTSHSIPLNMCAKEPHLGASSQACAPRGEFSGEGAPKEMIPGLQQSQEYIEKNILKRYRRDNVLGTYPGFYPDDERECLCNSVLGRELRVCDALSIETSITMMLGVPRQLFGTERQPFLSSKGYTVCTIRRPVSQSLSFLAQSLGMSTLSTPLK